MKQQRTWQLHARTCAAGVRPRAAASAFAVIAGLVLAGPAAAVPTTNWLDYTIIAEDRLDIGSNLNLTGNYAVTAVGGSLEVGQNTYQLDDAPPPFMAGDTINLASQASIVDAYTNLITGNASGEVRGQVFPQMFPLMLDLPTFPSAQVCDFCTVNAADVVVQPGDSITLTPGCYGELFARQDATVYLEPGSYRFFEWDIQQFADVIANGPVQIHIREQIASEGNSFFGPASANILDYQVWIGSKKACNIVSNAINTSIGQFSVVIGTLVAPEDDDFNFNKGAILMGTTVAREVDVRGTHEMRPPTPTPTPSSTPTPTPTGTPLVTSTPPATPTPTPTAVVTPTPTPTSVVTPTPTPTSVVTPTPTPTSVVTPTPTPTSVVTPTPTPTSVVTPTPTPTPVVTPTPTPIPTGTPIIPPTPTPTPGNTPTPGVTPTPGGPTPTPTPIPTLIPTPTPTQPFFPPTPTASVAPRKKPWGKKSGIIESLFPPRTNVAPSMKRGIRTRR